MATTWECPGCRQGRQERYCPQCGEEKLPKGDLTLHRLAARFVQGLSTVDGKLLRSVHLVLTRPGRLTAAYVRGQRRRYIGPLALFLVANAVFVGVQALTGSNPLSSPLDSHLHVQDWSGIAQAMVARRLAALHQSLPEYSRAFDQAAIFNAKALMILMVLAFAPIVALLFRKRRNPAGVHIVFALHVYAFILIFLCLSLALAQADHLMGGGGMRSAAIDMVLSVFSLGACAAYIYLAIGTAYSARGMSRIVKTAVLAAAAGALFVGYRFAIFVITLYSTS